MPALLIDVREYPEFAAAHIANSQLVPLSTVATASRAWEPTQPITLICKSGRRAEQARQQLAALNFTALTVLEGGIDAWRATGKPLTTLAKAPWSLERQVRIVAGSLILITMLLAHFVSPYFLFATAFVGAGLVFAGVSDICMMATVLGKLPWNRPQTKCRVPHSSQSHRDEWEPNPSRRTSLPARIIFARKQFLIRNTRGLDAIQTSTLRPPRHPRNRPGRAQTRPSLLRSHGPPVRHERPHLGHRRAQREDHPHLP